MLTLALLIGFASPNHIVAQASNKPSSSNQTAAVKSELHSHPDWPEAKPEDVRTVRAIVEAFFNAISAPAGGKIDRERLRSLFVPDGRIEIPLPSTNGKPTDVVFLTPDQYADGSDSETATTGFFDRMLALQVQQFGVMAHVYTSYESREKPEDPKPFVRGMKSLELLNSNGRWFLVQVSWDRERPGNPIPDRYLHDAEF